VFEVGERRLNEGVVGFVREIVMSVLDKDIQRVCLVGDSRELEISPSRKAKAGDCV
jgi:hypothetical protein